jgi:hypothetical protein
MSRNAGYLYEYRSEGAVVPVNETTDPRDSWRQMLGDRFMYQLCVYCLQLAVYDSWINEVH